MKDWWLSFCVAVHQQRVGLYALAIVIATWLALTSVIPSKYVDVFCYAIVGYYWLGGVLVPWVERKLQKLFS